MVTLMCYQEAHSLELDKVLNEIAALENYYPNKPVRLGISANYIEKGTSFHYRGNEKFLMASTVKVPIAIYTLKQIEENNLSLDESLKVAPEDLVPWSKLGYFTTHNPVHVSIADLIESMIAVSDNTATDIILKRIGGIKTVKNYFSNYEGISIDRSILEIFQTYYGASSNLTGMESRKAYLIKSDIEKDRLAKKFYNDMRDHVTPVTMTNILSDLVNGKFLSPDQTNFLLTVMEHTINHDRLLRTFGAGNVKLSHKTGTFDHESKNYPIMKLSDIGIFTLPNNEHLVMSIYAESTSDLKESEVSLLVGFAARVIYDNLYLNTK